MPRRSRQQLGHLNDIGRCSRLAAVLAGAVLVVCQLACARAQGTAGGPPLTQGSVGLAPGASTVAAAAPAPEPALEPLTATMMTPPGGAPVLPAPPLTQIDPSLALNNPLAAAAPASSPAAPEQPAALAPVGALAAAPAPEVPPTPATQALLAPAPEAAAVVLPPPTAAPAPAPSKAGSAAAAPSNGGTASNSTSSNSGSGGNGTVPSFNKNGQEYFITIGPDGNFQNGCQTFFPTGWNQFEVVEAAAGAPKLFAASIPPNKTGPQLIRDLMDDAVATGLNMVRFFALPVDKEYALQGQPGQFNEAAFRGLDYALESARVRGIKVILPLINNWNDTGGIGEVLFWNDLTTHEDFFTDPGARRTYRNTVKAILSRVNTINERTYAEDPTIMAWNLINEPRAYRSAPQLQAWIEEMAAYVKSLDTNHLLAIGEEGFWEPSSPSFDSNPQGAQSWAGTEGQDFLTNNQDPNIDFAVMHMWVDNWLDNTTQFPTTWINSHIADAIAMNKPLLLEEFGKYADGRQAFFINIYNQVAASAANGGPLKGSAFWQWYDDGQEVPGGGLGQYGLLLQDPTFTSIKQHANDMLALGKPIPGCMPRAYAGPAANACQDTWVDGKPGTGSEGPLCDIDVNECVRGTAGCAANAGCTNTNGSFSCACWYGYSGNGNRSCTANAQLQGLQTLYVAAGPGTLACDQGADVTVPAGAPGFAYDPMGAFASQNGFGTLLPVSVQGCQIACSMAGAGCDAISYNPTLEACYLKAGGSATDCPATQVACSGNTTTDQDGACADWTTYRRTGAAGPAAGPAAAGSRPAPAANAGTAPVLPQTPGAAGNISPLTADAAAPDVQAADGPPGSAVLGRRRAGRLLRRVDVQGHGE